MSEDIVPILLEEIASYGIKNYGSATISSIITITAIYLVISALFTIVGVKKRLFYITEKGPKVFVILVSLFFIFFGLGSGLSTAVPFSLAQTGKTFIEEGNEELFSIVMAKIKEDDSLKGYLGKSIPKHYYASLLDSAEQFGAFLDTVQFRDAKTEELVRSVWEGELEKWTDYGRDALDLYDDSSLITVESAATAFWKEATSGVKEDLEKVTYTTLIISIGGYLLVLFFLTGGITLLRLIVKSNRAQKQ